MVCLCLVARLIKHLPTIFIWIKVSNNTKCVLIKLTEWSWMTPYLWTTQSFENSKRFIYFECDEHPTNRSAQSIVRMNVFVNCVVKPKFYKYENLWLFQLWWCHKQKETVSLQKQKNKNFSSNSADGLWLIILWTKFHSNCYGIAKGQKAKGDKSSRKMSFFVFIRGICFGIYSHQYCYCF